MPFEVPLGDFRAPFQAPWGFFGTPWDPFGIPLGHLGIPLDPFLVSLGSLRPHFGVNGVLLGASGGQPGGNAALF